MQRYHFQWAVFALLIIGISSKVDIKYFDVHEPSNPNDRSSIAMNFVKLWADIAGCPEDNKCPCQVTVVGLHDEIPELQKVASNETLMTTTVSNLNSNTNYTLILSCQENASKSMKTIEIKTDYGRPTNSIDNLTITFNYPKIQINWTAPSQPRDSFTSYRILIDEKNAVSSLNPYYEIENNYIDNKTHTVRVNVCYKNNQNVTLCSNNAPVPAHFQFSVPTTPTVNVTSPATTTTTSNGINSYSISISLLLLLSFINLFSN